MEHAVKVQKEFAKHEVVTRSRTGAIVGSIICVPVLALCAYSWIAKPEFIWGPQDHTVMSPGRSEANMKFAIFLVAQRVEMYRAEHGVYPVTLTAIGADTSFKYTLIDGSQYQISGHANGKQILLGSTDDYNAFLGDSHVLIQQKSSR